ncbi:GTPase-activating protein GYP5 [Smittium mucronatum]|uniref:GTPase-activating protein GYP5 n=1 Tax=Smittium mucronatum TaxID=133383 RepID=A0A1R0H4R6_9FUNG|nr:GTPase-activating protein GYP5 [Smittium mucronatum]
MYHANSSEMIHSFPKVIESSISPNKNNVIVTHNNSNQSSGSDSEYSEFSDDSEDEDLVLARIELANAMLDLDPKAVVIQNNELKANKSILRSLAGNSKPSNPSSSRGIRLKKSLELRDLPGSKMRFSSKSTSDFPLNSPPSNSNILVDDKDTILTFSRASDSDSDIGHTSNTSLHKLNRRANLDKTPMDSLICESDINNTVPYNTNEIDSNNGSFAVSPTGYTTYTDDDYGENKAPDFILQAKSMKDIDLVANSWEYNLSQEPEGAFWSAVINDVNSIKRTTPHLISAKIRNGIPSKLRGVVWQGLSHGRSTYLQTMYYQLVKEHSPHERIIMRDLPRTFPNIEVFKDGSGDGQKRLFNILKAYSLYDAEVGYCQGLGFVIGPLMMNMGECEAFCVLVRLMETYDLRGMFTEDMDGLHLRLFQFSTLSAEILPQLWNHLIEHNIYPAMYAASWFLSLFAYALPLGFVLRVMDVLFCEGAAETIIRVGITLLSRNAKRLLAKNDFESMIGILTNGLYKSSSPDDQPLVVLNEANLLSNVVTTSRLNELSIHYHEKISKVRKPVASTTPIASSLSRGSDQSQTEVSSLPSRRAKANNTIMNFFNLSWMNSVEHRPKSNSVSSETRLRARQWLNDMQRQQSANSSDFEPDQTTGFDLLTLSGFDTTIDPGNNPSSLRVSESRACSFTESDNSSDDRKMIQGRGSLNSINRSGGKGSPYLDNSSFAGSDANSGNLAEFREENSFQHPMNSKGPINKKDEDIVEPLRRQLHDARVTADTNLHALASLRAEHELILSELARVKLDRAELESSLDEMQRTAKNMEIEKNHLLEQLISSKSSLDSTETALIKSRLRLADSEDMCFSLKGMMETASEYVEKKVSPIDKQILLKLLDTSNVFNQNTVNSQISDAIGTNLNGSQAQSKLEDLNSSYTNNTRSYSLLPSAKFSQEPSRNSLKASPKRTSRLPTADLALGNLFKIHSSENRAPKIELNNRIRTSQTIPVVSNVNYHINKTKPNLQRGNATRVTSGLDIRRFSKNNVDFYPKKPSESSD